MGWSYGLGGAISYGVGKLVLGNLADRFKNEFVIFFSMISIAVLLFIMPFSHNFAVFGILLIAMLFVQGGGLTPSVGLLCKWFSAKDRTIAYTIWSSSHRLGMAAIGFLAIYFINKGTPSATFYFPAVLSIISAVLLILAFPKYIEKPVDVIANEKLEKKKLDFNSAIFKNPKMLICSLIGFFCVFSLYDYNGFWCYSSNRK